MKRYVSDESTSKELGSGKEVHCRIEEIKNRLEEGVRASEKERAKPLTRHENEDAQKQTAFSYAKESGLWVDDFYTLGDRPLTGGNENALVVKEEDVIVYKSNNLFNHSSSIADFLDYIQLHNLLFPETKYDLIGFTGIDFGEDRTPYIEVVISQDYVPDAEQATQIEITCLMESMGFKQDENEYTFSNGEYIVSDLRPRNVLKDRNGNLYVVDNIVKKKRRKC